MALCRLRVQYATVTFIWLLDYTSFFTHCTIIMPSIQFDKEWFDFRIRWAQLFEVKIFNFVSLTNMPQPNRRFYDSIETVYNVTWDQSTSLGELHLSMHFLIANDPVYSSRLFQVSITLDWQASGFTRVHTQFAKWLEESEIINWFYSIAIAWKWKKKKKAKMNELQQQKKKKCVAHFKCTFAEAERR